MVSICGWEIGFGPFAGPNRIRSNFQAMAIYFRFHGPIRRIKHEHLIAPPASPESIKLSIHSFASFNNRGKLFAPVFARQLDRGPASPTLTLHVPDLERSYHNNF